MSELLELLAQLAVTIAALSAVAGATQSSSKTSEANYLLRDVALVGLTVALYAILPLLMLESELEPGLTLQICGFLAGLCWLVGYCLYIRRIWGETEKFTAAFFVSLTVTVLGMAFFTVNVFEPRGVFYVSGLVCLLAIAGLNFISAVFPPKNE